MQRATLGFCGLKPVRILVCGPVKDSSLAQRRKWLEKARRQGLKLQKGVVRPWERFRDKVIAWLKAIRLQFYPMTWVAYTVGALGAALQTGVFANSTYWLGYLCLFFLEVATVLTNEYVDFESDQQNKYFSAFTGGSRVLVEKQLSFKEVHSGIFAALVLTLAFAGLLLQTTADAASSGLVLLGMSILALGYTMPPLILVYRGLGELDVGITHSIAAILCGYVFQGGAINDPFPWLLGVPLFLAVLPSITLAGIPDYAADKAVSKNTLAVLIGPRRAAMFAMGTTALAAVTAAVWHYLGLAQGAFTGAAYFILPHAGLLLVLLYRYLKQSRPSARIDRLMVASLTYIIWFGAIPLFNLI
jgi:4-hydroxybenzoate polyprenyltransferase